MPSFGISHRLPLSTLIVVCSALVEITSPKSYAATEQNRSSEAILFQGFHWNSATYPGWYQYLGARVPEIKDLGVTHVWFPPPSNSGAREGYLPRELYNLNSAYGSEEQLAGVIAALRQQRIEAVADIVINHRVGNWNFADFYNPSWGCQAVANSDEWGGRCGSNDSGDSYNAARDIDHSQSFVQNDIIYWLNTRLRGVGFSGWRYDYSKGYSPYYAKLYHDASAPQFCVGELWPDFNLNDVNGHRQKLVDYVDATGGQCAAFDFTTKGLLNKVLRDGDFWRLQDSAGRAAGGIGYWAQKMVSFVDNHDTGPSETCSSGQNFWPVPCDKVMNGYAYILSHPGIPSVYYPHVFDWGLKGPIKALINARKAVGIQSTSSLAIQRAENRLYAAIVTGSRGRLAVKLGSADWSPSGNWTLAASGNEYAVWTQVAAPSTPTPPPSDRCQQSVTFTVRGASTAWGETVRVVGDHPLLGGWNPARGVDLSIQGQGSDAPWSASVELPANTNFQYKYVRWNGTQATWEGDALTLSRNREWQSPTACEAQLSRDDGSFRQP